MTSGKLTDELVIKGDHLLRQDLEELQATNPDLGNFHTAFEHYCMLKYGLGNSATNGRCGGKNDLGIDSFSAKEKSYHVIQCKIPDAEWLDANEGKVRVFGPQVIDDPRDTFRYLLGDSSMNANDMVRHLYALVESDREDENFHITFFIIVYGRLNQRATDALTELRKMYESAKVKIVLHELDDIVDEFLVGTNHASGDIKIDLRYTNKQLLRLNDYCYFLANSADIFTSFKDFGWRLFDNNVRYEVKNSAINGEILESLTKLKSRKNFHHYNNGLTIVVNNYSIRENDSRIHLHGAQIVNGLQTVKSIYNAVSTKSVSLRELETDCAVQIKVIKVNDAEIAAKIVQCTNNQNPMAARNLKANRKELRALRKDFASLTPRWFLQVKQGEWDSLTQEGGRFFKQVVGFPPTEFRTEQSKRKGRVIDNQDAAKAYLAFIGYADKAGAGSDYFTKDSDFELIFNQQPSEKRWKEFAQHNAFDDSRDKDMLSTQASASQYLLAYCLWCFAKGFVPSPQQMRQDALEEGVREGKIKKASGSFTSPIGDQEKYLADNHDYQTWRLMSNMKELLVEAATQILARKYGPLNASLCLQLLHSPDTVDFFKGEDIRPVAQAAVMCPDISSDMIFSRIFCLLRYAAGQIWEEKKTTLQATQRVRLKVLERNFSKDFKDAIWAADLRVRLDKPWKPEGTTFINSLPTITIK